MRTFQNANNIRELMKKVSYNIKCPECDNLMIHAGFTYSGNREDVEKIFDIPVYSCQKCQIIYIHREEKLLIMYIVAEPLQGKVIEINQEQMKIQIDMELFKRKHQYLHKRITNGISEIIIKGDIKDFYKDLYENTDIEIMGNYNDGNILKTTTTYKTQGLFNVLSIGLGTNISERLYLGMSINVPSCKRYKTKLESIYIYEIMRIQIRSLGDRY